MTIIEASWDIFLSLAPWVLLGMFVAGALHVFLPPNFLSKHLKGRSGVFKAVALGVPLPLCSCGVIPAGLGLKKDGASDGASVGFLISTPQTGVDSILVSGNFLGWPFALFKVLAAFVTGIIGGLLTDALSSPKTPDLQETAARKETNQGSLREGLEHAVQILDTIWLWIIVGVVASAAITLWIPNAVFVELNSWGTLPAMFAVLLVSLPLYVCATASVPIAAALVAGGLPFGSALVFLMAGPATNLATIGALYGSFGRKTTTIYLATIILFSVGFGLCADLLITPPNFSEINHHEHHSWWATGSAWFLLGLMAYIVFRNTQRKLRAQNSKSALSEKSLQIPVHGMTCNGCVNKLTSALSAREDVAQVVVTLEPGQATVEGTIGLETLRDAIHEAGFETG